MMRGSPICRAAAFAEAAVDLRLPAALSVESRCLGHFEAHRSPVRLPHFPLFAPPEPFRHARTEGQKHIQNP